MAVLAVAAKLAKRVKAVWDAIKAVRAEKLMPAKRVAGEPPEITGEYNRAALEKILGGKGKRNGEVMIGETPSYYFLHYWGKGEPEALARGLRAALDTQE